MLSFRARLFLAFALLWLLFLGGGWYLAGRSVDQALKRRLEATLAQDALRAAEAYQKGQAGALLTTGGVYLHLYAQDGTPIALTRPDHRLPPERLRRAGPTPEVLWEEGFAAALVATPLGLLVLTAETSPIEAALEALREALLRAFLLLSPLGLALVYLTARLAARPLEAVAREITRRSPDRLDPVPHRLPQDEFGRMVEAVNALLQALKEAKERERAFLAEASHELRTPLTVLLGHLDRLGRNPQDLEALRTARATAERMRRLVEDLLALARGEVERNLNLHIVDLGEVAREAALEHGVAAEAESAEVLGDPDRLLQLLRNLVANAVRAAGKEGVRVRVRREADHALLEVEDSGPGIPSEDRSRAVEPFVRLSNAPPRDGSGLGLNLAAAVARLHGGSLRLEDNDPGLVARLDLPVGAP